MRFRDKLSLVARIGSAYKALDENAVRLDLDDLGGEICLLDWGFGGDDEPAISPPNRSLPIGKLLGGAVNVVLLHLENVMAVAPN